jgi:acyl carrier protein
VPYEAPAGELEERIAAVWGRALGFEEVGVLDNFFDLGGDSFVAIQVASELRDELGVDLPAAKLYQGLTVRSLAALLAADGSTSAAARAGELEERRAAMDRRRDFQERRRARRRVAEVADE